MAESAPLLRVYRWLKPIEGSNPSLSASFCLLGLLFLSACQQQEHHEIQWQLPLDSQHDKHANPEQSPLPDWAKQRQGSIRLLLLNTQTTQKASLELSSEQTAEALHYHITLLGLATGLRWDGKQLSDQQQQDNPAAFIEIQRHNKVLYRGWVYQKFPELFGPDIKGLHLWLKMVKVRAVPQAAVRKSSLSSAG